MVDDLSNQAFEPLDNESISLLLDLAQEVKKLKESGHEFSDEEANLLKNKIPFIKFPNLTKEESFKVWKLEKQLVHHVFSANRGKESAIVYNLRDNTFEKEEDRRTICDGDEKSVNIMENGEAKTLIQTAKSIAVIILHNHPSSSNMSLADVTLFLNNPSILLLTVVKHNGFVEYVGRSSYSDINCSKKDLSSLVTKVMDKLGYDIEAFHNELLYPTNISADALYNWKKEIEDNPEYIIGENKRILCEREDNNINETKNSMCYLDEVYREPLRKLILCKYEALRENFLAKILYKMVDGKKKRFPMPSQDIIKDIVDEYKKIPDFDSVCKTFVKTKEGKDFLSAIKKYK